MNIEILLGKTREHLVPLDGTKYLLHKDMIHDFLLLRKSAESAGFNLQIASAFRDYERQLKIWNSKARGERPLLDDQGNPLNFASLSPKEVMFAILRWSAIPGASRHHWGTDIDVFDGLTQKSEDVKLEPAETEGSGPAAALHDWLDTQIAEGQSYGFYRPYQTDRGGVSPERWHLSHNPTAHRIVSFYTYPLFKKNISESEILLKEELLESSEEVFQRYFSNLDLP